MFSVGEYIVYGVEGVCEVEAAGRMKVSGFARTTTAERFIRRSTGRP